MAFGASRTRPGGQRHLPPPLLASPAARGDREQLGDLAGVYSGRWPEDGPEVHGQSAVMDRILRARLGDDRGYSYAHLTTLLVRRPSAADVVALARDEARVV